MKTGRTKFITIKILGVYFAHVTWIIYSEELNNRIEVVEHVFFLYLLPDLSFFQFCHLSSHHFFVVLLTHNIISSIVVCKPCCVLLTAF